MYEAIAEIIALVYQLKKANAARFKETGGTKMNEAASKPKKGIGLADILISVIVLAIIGLIIIPLPSALLDILIIINLTIAINILLITLFTKSVLEFTTFPTLLLITTMFRLGLESIFHSFDLDPRKWRTRDRCLRQCRCRQQLHRGDHFVRNHHGGSASRRDQWLQGVSPK